MVPYQNLVLGDLSSYILLKNYSTHEPKNRFGAFETFKGYMVRPDGNLDPMARMLCGLGAGVCEAIFAVTPMETIKVKFINDRRKAKPEFRGFLHGVGMIIKSEGFSALFLCISF